MSPRPRTDVVETLSLGDVTARIIRHDVDGRVRHTVAFAPSGLTGRAVAGFQPDEFDDLVAAVSAASAAILRDHQRIR